ncbi:MAG: Unknown protein [uncultured Thiotrichaceae bacterium]|uniref:Type II secretion system protein H n=1 Tax=uncultured Thiotrichaceae bacterium TaxID=298394 RepID=A0A6S6SY24_9GAMM|nr:MAG: Unknown protein [uncultured Thiotrichaceae bacterium]
MMWVTGISNKLTLGFVPKKRRGFTLLELLIVMVIIGVIVGAATLSIPHNKTSQIEKEAQRFQALLKLARDEAVFQSRSVGVLFEESGYQFMLSGEEQGQWVALSDKQLRPRVLPEGFSFRVDVQGQMVSFEDADSEERLVPHVFVLSTGEITPFNVTISDTALHEIEMRFDGFGNVKKDDAL